jgi:hypothetical protein
MVAVVASQLGGNRGVSVFPLTMEGAKSADQTGVLSLAQYRPIKVRPPQLPSDLPGFAASTCYLQVALAISSFSAMV